MPNAPTDTQALVLPTALEALWLAHGAHSTGPLVDPTVLPWVDARTGHDRNPDRAWVADEIITPPFETADGLEPGVHLRWVLPDLLRRARHPLDAHGREDLSRVVFPRVPDRWLVTRLRNSQAEARWLVESDHVWGADQRPPRGTVQALLPPWVRREGAPPSRGLGRVLALDGQTPPPAPRVGAGWEDATGLPLTALGPAEDFTFAALYPNSRHVFGLHDPHPGDGPVHYTVVGWYAQAARDLIQETLRLGGQNDAFSGSTPGTVLHERLGHDLGDLGPAALEPAERIVCRGALALEEPSPASVSRATVQVALGETPEQALIAHLADDVDERLPGTAALAEQSLQALRHARSLEGFKLDLGPRLTQALHQEGFAPVPGGTRYKVVLRDELADKTGVGSGRSADGAREITLPPEAAEKLEELNRAQAACDAALRLLDRTAEAVAHDHARLMRATARPPDRPQDMPDLDLAMDALRDRVGSTAMPGTLRDLQVRVDQALTERDDHKEALEALIQAHNAEAPDAEDWALLSSPATRFWQPRDPAVLLSGDAIRTSTSYEAADGDDAHGTAPSVRTVASWPPIELASDVDHAPTAPDANAPLLMEWRAEILPDRASQHIRSDRRRYPPDWLASEYTFKPNDPDLHRRTGSETVTPAGVVVEGRTILTPSAPDVLEADIMGWLSRWFQRNAQIRETESREATDGPDPDGQEATARADLRGALCRLVDPEVPAALASVLPSDQTERDAFFDWLAGAVRVGGAAHPARILIEAWEALDNKRGHLLGQQLDGLRRGLIGLRATVPLDLANPQGFEDYRDATSQVRDAVAAAFAVTRGQRRPRSVPVPDGEYLPLKAGHLRLLELRLIDAFGRPTDVRWTEVDRPAGMTVPAEDQVAFPPRLSQPARLSFRWLTADPLPGDALPTAESTDHPATSPICGWLVADHLDRSVLVFDGQGTPLGAVEPPGLWRLPPGGAGGVVRPAEIPNRGLRDVVAWLVDGARTDGFLEGVLDLLEGAQDRMAPEAHLDEAAALLTSRPVAVVRARMDLELHGPPVTDQGWHAWREGLRGGSRSTRGFDDVDVPVRIGEHQMLDDGVVGYFVEDADGSLVGDRLFCPQGAWAEGGRGDSRVVSRSPDDPDQMIRLAPSDPPVFLTVLLDPRGRLHATTGVLPTRSLTVPPDQYRPPLERIAPWFRVMPLLSGPGDLELDLPPDATRDWVWAALTPDGWETARAPEPKATDADPAGGEDSEPAPLPAPEAGPPPGPPPPAIVPAPRAPTVGATTAREGWVQLIPVTKTS